MRWSPREPSQGKWRPKFALFPTKIADANEGEWTIWLEWYWVKWTITSENWAGTTYAYEYSLSLPAEVSL